MNNAEPTYIKLMEHKLAMPLALAALAALYPLLFFLFNKNFFSIFILSGLPSALGVVAAWAAIKKWKVDQRPVFTKHNIRQRTLAFGTGGALAGLIFMLATLSQEFLCDKQSMCDINDECVTTVLDVVYMLPLFGQIFWLIWPVAAIKVIWSNKLRLVKIAGIFERLIIFTGAAALIPGVAALVWLVVALIAMAVYS